MTRKPWTAGEAATVNEFLNSPVGMRWLQTLFARRPKDVNRDNTEKAALDGAYLAGYEKAWEEIANTRTTVKESESFSVQAIDATKD